MYLRAANKQSVEQGKIVAVFFLSVCVCLFVCFCEFMLNPFMYTLRKNIVKQPLRRVFMRNFHAMKKSSIQQFPNGKKRVSKNKIVFLGGCS